MNVDLTVPLNWSDQVCDIRSKWSMSKHAEKATWFELINALIVNKLMMFQHYLMCFGDKFFSFPMEGRRTKLFSTMSTSTWFWLARTQNNQQTQFTCEHQPLHKQFGPANHKRRAASHQHLRARHSSLRHLSGTERSVTLLLSERIERPHHDDQASEVIEPRYHPTAGSRRDGPQLGGRPV